MHADGLERVGFLLVWVGAAFGVVALGWAVRVLVVDRGAHTRPDLIESAAVLGASVVAGSLWLTWIDGYAPGGRFVEQSAWVALDPVSTGLAALLALAALGLAFGSEVSRSWPLASVCVSLATLIGGNVLIQATTERGSHLRLGGYVAAAGSVLLLATAASLAHRASDAGD